MSQPLTDQRQRAELIAELYDRHAAGLFAYCADQLGDLGSASDVLVSLFSSVAGFPSLEKPPRASLYAFARREIHRRDIVYAPSAVDPLIDPATALVERVLRELRPHQREVLVLRAVCGLSMAELAWVLDVAPDTAEELAVGADHHFRQALGAALASTGARVPKPVADVYGALSVAPLRDVLGRLPWPQPPGALRFHFVGSRTAAPGPLFVKPRWPSPPNWPQPLADADPATSTVIFPAELLTPPPNSRTPAHDATTAPMPKLGESADSSLPRRDPLTSTEYFPLRDPLGSLPPLRDPLEAVDGARPYVTGSLQTGTSGPSDERPFFLAPPEFAGGLEPFATGDVILPKDAPEPFATGDVLLPGNLPKPFADDGDILAPRDVLVHKGPARPLPQPQPQPQRADEPSRDAAPLFRPRAKSSRRPEPAAPTAPARPAEPIYRLPAHDEEPALPREEPSILRAEPAPAPAASRQKPSKARTSRESPSAARSSGQKAPAPRSTPAPSPTPSPAPSAAESSLLAPRPVRARPTPKKRPEYRARPEKVRRRKDRHFDWAWEAVGFLICVAIAMIVFFSMPMFTHP
ncbi:sigma-70 family RNA polymerase sigma factor [Nonomuraea sp. NPDC050786]|uniref:sigma-70 family RNA polymerase sigma factor n=1 Tax=Nonomuraea sp. NPDC050786 TaxID=3154840 RepID=UPI0033F2CCD9